MFRRLLHLLARPVPRRRGLVIQTFRGYGYAFRDNETSGRIFLMGRVLRQPFASSVGPSGKLFRDLLGVVRRTLRWGAGGVELEVRAGDSSEWITCDSDGFFQVDMEVANLQGKDGALREVRLRVPTGEGAGHHEKGGAGEMNRAGGDDTNRSGADDTNSSDAGEAHRLGAKDDPRFGAGEADWDEGNRAQATGQVYVPPPGTPYLVISDIDDTVVHTGVARKLVMLWNTFMEGAESKTAFPGAAAFYRALHRGSSGRDQNPMFYVSRGPWSIYEVLLGFLRVHRFPDDPVLFLRDWGMTLRHPLPRRGRGYKEDLVRQIVDAYSDLPLVLIGDSGQKDPEIYAEVVRENPGRVLAVYIRNVTRTEERDTAIQRLARESARTGTDLVLADDSFVMAEDAAERGLISRDALPEVLKEKSGEKSG